MFYLMPTHSLYGTKMYLWMYYIFWMRKLILKSILFFKFEIFPFPRKVKEIKLIWFGNCFFFFFFFTWLFFSLLFNSNFIHLCDDYISVSLKVIYLQKKRLSNTYWFKIKSACKWLNLLTSWLVINFESMFESFVPKCLVRKFSVLDFVKFISHFVAYSFFTYCKSVLFCFLFLGNCRLKLWYDCN